MRGYHCYGYKVTKTPGECVIVLVPSCKATKTPGNGIIVLVTKIPKIGRVYHCFANDQCNTVT